MEFKCVNEKNKYMLGQINNDLIEGMGYLIDDNAISFGDYNNSLLNGTGLMYYKEFKAGEFNNGLLNGIGFIQNDEGCYIGHFINCKKNGLGIYVFSNNDFLISNFINDELNGKAIYYSNEASMLYARAYRKNNLRYNEKLANIKINLPNIKKMKIEKSFLNAKSIPCIDDSFMYYGQFAKTKSGFGICTWNDDLKYYGFWKNDQRDGLGIYKFNDDSTYIGESENDNINGLGLYILDEEDYYFGSIKDGNYNGNGLLFSEGSFYITSFLDDEMVDKGIIIDYDLNLVNYNFDDKSIIEKYPFPKYDESMFSEDKLDSLIGLEPVKKQLNRIKSYIIKNKDKKINIHMSFNGNPGTGKTTVARLMGEILYKNGILKNTNFIEASRDTIVEKYVGHTAKNMHEIIGKAMGGVLFIDEAYSLANESKNDFGHEAIDVLLKEMEDKRGDFCCILAGYNKEMNKLYNSNPGLKSRIQFFIDFPDYTKDELKEIAYLQLEKDGYKASDECVSKMIDIVYLKRNEFGYSNAREVRNILSLIEMIQSERTISDKDNRTINMCDVLVYIKENKISLAKKEFYKLPDKETLIENSKKINLAFNPKDINVKEAIISIECKNEFGFSESSGFVITSDGYAITCAHCVKNAEKIISRRRILDRLGNEIELYHNSVISYINNDLDIAIIKLDNDGDFYSFLPIANEENVSELSMVSMLGYPFGSSEFDRLSIVSGKIMSKQIIDNKEVYNLDILAKSGNSGSCIIDNKTGQVIGILCGSKLNANKSLIEEINYCISIKYIWDIFK